MDGARPCALAFYDHLVREDAHGARWFEALWSEARSAILTERLEWWRARLAEIPPGRAYTAGPLRPGGAGLVGHRAAVAETRQRIWDGEMFQANICLSFEGPFRGDPLDLWVTGDAAVSPGYSAFVDDPDHSGVSLSPELFLRRAGA